MNFDEIVVKESPGLCRCCLSEGCYKDLSSEYTWMNETEVYADMLLECFDISISQHSDGPNGSNRLICEVCITRLRDACNFKKQVVDSEKRFIDMLAKGEFEPRVVIYEASLMKSEGLEEQPAEEAEVEYLDDGIDYEDDLPLKQVLGTSEASISDVIAEPIKVKGKRGRPKKSTTVVKAEKRKTTSEDKPRSSKTVSKGALPPLSNPLVLTATKRNRLVKRNAIILLENTTVLPFKWHRQNYLCFFCHQPFKDFEDLKSHTKSEQATASIKSSVSFLRRDEKVKIDLSDAQCSICSTSLDTLDQITQHLKSEHGKVFSEADYGVIPYSLQRDNFQCVLCKETFQYFVKLNQHLNEHYGKYICENCGKSFLSQDRLRCHSLSHGQSFPCTSCPEVFNTLTQRNQHETKVHGKVRIQCFYCRETFQNYAQRKKHHSAAHNIQTKHFSCPYCGKQFTIMSKMKVHVKEVHLREKNHSCTMCDQKFFSKTHVQKHMVKHFGDRIHQCAVCKKSYARKQTLRDHMRIHSSEKRYVCAICSSGFVQNNSLRLHMRVHHPDSLGA